MPVQLDNVRFLRLRQTGRDLRAGWSIVELRVVQVTGRVIRRPVALAVAAYLALTVLYTWPLGIRLMHGVAHDPGDPLLNAWILWWTTQAAPLTAHWWNAPIFYPATGVFAFSEHLLGFAPLTAPLIALTGSPLFGYNVALLATYVLSALGAYFLAFTLTRRHDAAFVAGLAFGFAPYRLAQVPHIQVLASVLDACLPGRAAPIRSRRRPPSGRPWRRAPG